MDNKVALQVALANINSIFEVLKDNPSFDVINPDLVAVRDKLQKQLGEEPKVTVTEPIPPNPPIAIPPKKKQNNTYSVLTDSTVGWEYATDNSKGLSKEDAEKQYINILVIKLTYI